MGANPSIGRGEDDDFKAGHVFISYQWDSQQTVVQIRDRLVQEGYNVWLDLDCMEGDILEAMAAGVAGADAVVICFSQKYRDSQNCKTEANYAYTQQKPMIPLRMEPGYKPAADSGSWLGALLNTKLYYDFSRPELFDDSMRKLIKALGENGKSRSSTRVGRRLVRPAYPSTSLYNSSHMTEQHGEVPETSDTDSDTGGEILIVDAPPTPDQYD